MKIGNFLITPHRLRLFENRMLRRTFEPKRDEVEEGWGRPHNEEPRNLNTSSNIIRMIKPRKMEWTGHVARIGR
jgi:hypothetical protein